MSKYLEPKCFDYQSPAYTAQGYFLPCCWCDRRNSYFEDKGFYDEQLNISNVEDIVTEVFNSKQWVDFFYDLEYNPENAPSVCHEHCGANKETFKKISL